MSRQESKPLTVYLVVFMTLFMVSAAIYVMVYLSPPGPPDTRTWEQKAKDKAYHECWIESGSVKDVRNCYETIYGKPVPAGNKTP